jgi:hypothetical protein
MVGKDGRAQKRPALGRTAESALMLSKSTLFSRITGIRRSRNTMGLVEQTMTPDDLTLRTPGSREASLASDLEALQARADISPK